MRRQHTFLAMAAMMAAGATFHTKENPTGYKPRASMGNNPFFNPTRSQRVKNKQNRKRYSK